MDKKETNFKTLILARYTGEFLQATEEDATERKTSAQIVIDLRPVAEFSINEIAKYLIGAGYSIAFEDSTPMWLLRKEPTKELGM